jgi:hypothetical protein
MQLSRRIAEASLTDKGDLIAAALSLTRDLVPGTQWVSLTCEQKGRPSTPAATDPVAESLDAVQYQAGEGPCLAALHAETVVVSSFDGETRWPAFTSRIRGRTPAQAALSYPLAPAGRPGFSVNLYSDANDTFNGIALHTAAMTAAGFALALSAIEQRHRAEHLEIALETSRTIGAAVGILMYGHRWTREQAFDALRTASQNHHCKLRDIADEVLLTGTLPLR